jgi:S-DNA-T family DNA segregation ATPase FtsK/SpoIIIE
VTEKKNQLKKNILKKEQEKQEKKEVITSKKTSFSLRSFFSSFKDERFRKITGAAMILFSAFLLLSFTSYLLSWKNDYNYLDGSFFRQLFNSSIKVENWMGRLGALIANVFIKKWFGVASFLFILIFLVTGIRLLLRISILPIWRTYKYSFFGLIWTSVFIAYVFRSENLLMLGGIFGYQSNIWLEGIIGNIGTALLLFFSMLGFLIIVFNFSFKWISGKKPVDEEDPEDETDNMVLINKFKDTTEDLSNKENPTKEELSIDFTEPNFEKNKKPQNEDVKFIIENPSQTEKEELNIDNDKTENEVVIPSTEQYKTNVQYDAAQELLNEKGEYDPKLELSAYEKPSTDLLDEYGSNTINVQKEELEANKNRIVETLNNYAIQIDTIKATIGPTVTLYEIIPAPGVRISKIKNLEDDIALSLSALGIRIIAPIPGKGTVGIEVPNRKPEIVSMKSILTSEKFINSTFDLPIGLGKTISNECFIADLAKMPHLLMAGATGQGKSVGLNAIIASILHKKHPSEVKFILVDPKKVELTLFSKIERHFLAKLPDSDESIITDTRKVVRTLNSLCIEMDQRYDLLKDAQTRNIKEYNAKFVSRRLNPNDGHRFLPYIILIVDEFADLIMTAGKEIEMPIARLAQLARAIGIHLIIATQRPSVNIITGTIKANFPTRIAFRVASKIDSRTILDTGGADQLIGRGDMLVSNGSEIIRVQCAFIDTPEIEKMTEFIGNQRGYTDAFHLPEYAEDNGNADNLSSDPNERDELFEEAARIIVASQQGSTSLLQRKLKLGYNRAGRLIDQLEAAGIVGPFEGSKAREVKIKDDVALEQILNRNRI